MSTSCSGIVKKRGKKGNILRLKPQAPSFSWSAGLNICRPHPCLKIYVMTGVSFAGAVRSAPWLFGIHQALLKSLSLSCAATTQPLKTILIPETLWVWKRKSKTSSSPWNNQVSSRIGSKAPAQFSLQDHTYIRSTRMLGGGMDSSKAGAEGWRIVFDDSPTGWGAGPEPCSKVGVEISLKVPQVSLALNNIN